MDGGGVQFSKEGITGWGDALMQIASRMGAAEATLKEKVSHEKLMETYNGLRRDVQGMVRDSETHLKGAIEAVDAQNAARNAELLRSLDSMFSARVDGAVTKALAAQREAERQAREDVENKSKDAVRGIRLLMTGGGSILGGGIVLLLLFIAKSVFGWSPF